MPQPRCASGRSSRDASAFRCSSTERRHRSRPVCAIVRRARLQPERAARPCARQRHWYERCALLHDIDRPGDTRHSIGHPVGCRPPAVVLERVDDRASAATGRPAHRARRANERWQEIAPSTAMTNVRMPTACALRVREHVEPRPAESADYPAIAVRQRACARDAYPRHQEIGKPTQNSARDAPAWGASEPADRCTRVHAHGVSARRLRASPTDPA